MTKLLQNPFIATSKRTKFGFRLSNENVRQSMRASRLLKATKVLELFLRLSTCPAIGRCWKSSTGSNLQKRLKAFKMKLPPLPEQKAIAHILGTLDDKIELNRRMNATLEGMAQALFKSWFVDFDPVIDNALAAGNPIPDELAPRAEVRKKALANGTTQQGSVDHPTLSDPKSLFPAAFQFTEELGWIPEGWEESSLETLAIPKRGKTEQKAISSQSGAPWMTKSRVESRRMNKID